MSTYVKVHDLAPEVAVDIDFDNHPTSETRTWTSVSDRLREIRVQVYRATELDDFQVGSLQVVLDNRDRELEPTFLASPRFPVVPRRPIRYRAKWAGVEYERFWGLTRTHPIQWPAQVDAVTVIEAADFAMILNRDQVQLNGFPEEAADDRIGRVLDSIGVPASVRDIDTSDAAVAAVPAVDEAAGVAPIVVGALAHCQDAARSDGGYFFIGRDGTVTFHNRYHRRDVLGSVADTFGDSAAEAPYRPDLVGMADDSRLWNRAAVLTAAAVREEVTNNSSAERYWTSRRDDFQSLLAYPADANARASLYVWRYSQEEPTLRFPRLNVRAFNVSFANLPALLAADVGTRFGVKRRPPGGGAAIDKQVHVEGIAEQVAIGGGTPSWDLGFDVSPADPELDPWVLGTSELAHGDDFEDGTLDTATWTLSADADVDFLETGGNAQFTIDTTGSGSTSCDTTVTTLNMTGRQWLVELVDAGLQQSTTFARLGFYDDATHTVFFRVTNGQLLARVNTGGGEATVATATYRPTLHRWLRIREASGTTFWEYAPSRGGPWQALHSASNPITVTSGTGSLLGGSTSTPAAQTVVKFGWAGMVHNSTPTVVGY